MRHPARQRNIGIVVALLVVVVVIGALMLLQGRIHSVTLDWIVVVGAVIAIGSVIYAIHAVQDAMAYNKLMEGRGVLARWTVEPAIWQAFVKADHEMTAKYPLFANVFSMTANPRPDGVEVIFGKHGVIMDGDYQMLPVMVDEQQLNWLEIIQVAQDPQGPASFINMHVTQTYYAGAGINIRKHSKSFALRIPVAESAMEDARTIVQWFDQQAKKDARQYDSDLEARPLLYRNLALVFVVLGLGACVFAFIYRNHPDLDMQDRVSSAATIGLITTVIAMALAWVGHVLHQRKLIDDETLG